MSKRGRNSFEFLEFLREIICFEFNYWVL